MLIDATLETFPMIGGHDHRGVPQSPCVFQFRNKRSERAIGSCDELIIAQAKLVDLALLVGIIMRIPSTLIFVDVAQLVRGEKTSPVRRVGKIRVVRRHHVDPQEESIR